MGSHETEVRAVLDGLRRIVQALRESSRGAGGLPPAQVFVLQQLAAGPAPSLNELAARTFTHQSSVSVVVSKLVERRLVERRASEVDARRLEISLTAAGRALVRRAPEAPQAKLLAAIERLPSVARRALGRGISRLVAELGEAEEAPPMMFEDAPARRARRRP